MNKIQFPTVTVCLPGSVRGDYDFTGNIAKCTMCGNISSSCYFNEMCSFEEKALPAISPLMWSYREFNIIAPWEPLYLQIHESLGGKEFLMYSTNVLLPHCNVQIAQSRHIIGLKWYKYPVGSMIGCYGKDYIIFVLRFGMCFTMNGLRNNDILKETSVISSEGVSVNNGYFKEFNYDGKKLYIRKHDLF